MTPIDYLYRTAARTPDAPAVILPGGHLTYAQLAARVDALAAGLQTLDPTPGSRVGICAKITIEHLLGLLACLAAEKTWVPLNPRDAKPELDAKIKMTTPSLLIADESCLNLFTPPANTPLILAKGGKSDDQHALAGLMENHKGEKPQRRGRQMEDTQAIKFTGGTSGRPKGVLQPVRAWLTGAANAIHAMQLTAADRYLMATPITHGASCYITPLLAVGGAFVFVEGQPDATKIVKALSDGQASLSFMPPTLLYALMDVPGVADKSFPALRHLIYGGAPMLPERIRRAQKIFGPVIATNYGQTEAPQMIALNSGTEMQDAANLAAAGRPGLLTSISIQDGEGNLLPANESGEICVGGDLVMSGYLDMPEETAKTLKNGWLHTGDVGYLDERGYLFIKDRLRDVIITGGFNVYPTDVEAVLATHPEIAECCVFGLEDEKWGEQVTAAIRRAPGSSLEADDVIAFAKEQLGSVKAPKAVHFLDSLPRSPVGKVLKREVQQQIADLAS